VARPETRLYCKKCHTPFYIDRAGRAVLGEPKGADPEELLKQKVRETVQRFPIKKVVGGLAALLVVSFLANRYLRPVENLKPAAEKAARAFAGNDVDYLRSIAAPGTAEDVERWYDFVHPLLVQKRQGWAGKAEAVDVSVAKEDPAERKAAVGVSIHPGFGNARDVSLANPADATAGPLGSVDLEMHWTLNDSGRWELDGHQMYAKAHP
jgi:hypothetical protein